ncbi:hypothetical protein DV737_g37, partial [Chaetothyriales sp. CBS 132003]
MTTNNATRTEESTKQPHPPLPERERQASVVEIPTTSTRSTADTANAANAANTADTADTAAVGKGTPRRKTKKVHKSSGTDDKKLQTSLKKLNVQPIQAIEEVNMFKEDGNVIHFAAPKVHASVPSNTFAIYGNGEDKELTELVPGILNQLGPDSLASLRRLAESYQSLQKKEGGDAKKEGEDDDDEIPDLADIPIPSVKKAAKKDVKPRTNAAAKSAAKPTRASNSHNDGAIVKPKQSKSRNGCVTCKKKRLKCDETKPHCQQCARRNVACEGYRKDYKWRSFEDTTFNPNKPWGKPRNQPNPGNPDVPIELSQPHISPLPTELLHLPNAAPAPVHSLSPGLDLAFASAAHALHGELADKTEKVEAPSGNFCDGLSGNFCDSLDSYSLPGTVTTASNDDGSGQSAGSTFSSISPHLSHLCLPGTDLTSPPDASELRPPMSPHPYQPGNSDPSVSLGLEDGQDFDEEVVRDPSFMAGMPSPTIDNGDWALRSSSPTLSETSSTSSKSSSLTILAEPRLSAASPEMLALRFDKHTCGILSIKDGPLENPWRDLIWPLAHKSQALYHALNSMIAFHGSSDIAALRVEGMRQFTKSIKNLSHELEHMRTDTALATALALAFSEGWDHHTTTGIQHLKGAKTMVNNAVVKHCQHHQLGDLMPHDAVRLKFLCNTFVYMDVIARLSSLDKASDFNLAELVAVFNPIKPNFLVDIDPLLGCAADLFPIIGRVASLVQVVRQTPTNTLQIVGEASELKDQLHHWEMPRLDMFDPPHDSTTRVQHAMMTAEAYRYATLLYLHQAVPEMASESTSVLAKQVLLQLTNVPTWSRCLIIQIFPLLAAGCEVESDDDRSWVLQRWHSMILRLKIGNVNRCLDVIQEAWSRRDMYEAEKQEQLSRRYSAARSTPDVPVTLPRPHPHRAREHNMDGPSAGTTGADTVMGRHANHDDSAGNSAPMKPWLTSDITHPTLEASAMPSVPPSSRLSGSTIGDPAIDRIEPPYTVRGRLHWLGIMVDHGWEAKLWGLLSTRALIREILPQAIGVLVELTVSGKP